jgi:clan AA aspartic protease
MGLVHADITLLNAVDDGMAKRGVIPREKVRSTDVRALVDTGAYMMTINEKLRDELGLELDHHVIVVLADGQRATCELVGLIKIIFKTRATVCLAVVLPGATEVLLGAIPLEGMDVIVDPGKQELTLPPDRPQMAQTIIM